MGLVGKELAGELLEMGKDYVLEKLRELTRCQHGSADKTRAIAEKEAVFKNQPPPPDSGGSRPRIPTGADGAIESGSSIGAVTGGSLYATLRGGASVAGPTRKCGSGTRRVSSRSTSCTAPGCSGPRPLSPQAAGTAVPVHHPPGAVGRMSAAQCRRACGAQAQEPLARLHQHIVMLPQEFMQLLEALV